RRLRRHVPLGEPGPAGGEDHVHLARVRPPHELPHDAVGLVRHHAPHRHLVAARARPLENRIAGRIRPLANSPKVTDGQNPDPHKPPPTSTILHQPPLSISLFSAPQKASPPPPPAPACRARRS